MKYVLCPETISSPAPNPGALRLGIQPNMKCGARCEVKRLGPVMAFRCPRGHQFYASPSEVVEE